MGWGLIADADPGLGLDLVGVNPCLVSEQDCVRLCKALHLDLMGHLIMVILGVLHYKYYESCNASGS